MNEPQKEKRLRLYEVRAMRTHQDGTIQDLGVFLVDAPGREAARRYVAEKFIGPAAMPNGHRVAELMAKGVRVETVERGDE